jgi:hypothetical protein
VRAEARCGNPSGHPAIVVVGPRGELRAVTPAAREWQDRLDETAPDQLSVVMQVMAVGARAAARSRRSADRPAASGVRFDVSRARHVREVIAGHSTTDIAGRRFISAHTVQDHLEVNVRQGRRPQPWRARGSAATRWFLRR